MPLFGKKKTTASSSSASRSLGTDNDSPIINPLYEEEDTPTGSVATPATAASGYLQVSEVHTPKSREKTLAEQQRKESSSSSNGLTPTSRVSEEFLNASYTLFLQKRQAEKYSQIEAKKAEAIQSIEERIQYRRGMQNTGFSGALLFYENLLACPERSAEKLAEKMGLNPQASSGAARTHDTDGYTLLSPES